MDFNTSLVLQWSVGLACIMPLIAVIIGIIYRKEEPKKVLQKNQKTKQKKEKKVFPDFDNLYKYISQIQEKIQNTERDIRNETFQMQGPEKSNIDTEFRFVCDKVDNIDASIKSTEYVVNFNTEIYNAFACMSDSMGDDFQDVKVKLVTWKQKLDDSRKNIQKLKGIAKYKKIGILCTFIRSLYVYNVDEYGYKGVRGLTQDKKVEITQKAYKYLVKCCDTFARYNNIPSTWIRLPYISGFLTDLLAVLRRPKQCGLGDKHMYNSDELVARLKIYFEKQENRYRYPFLMQKIYPSNCNSVDMQQYFRESVENYQIGKLIGWKIFGYNVSHYYAIDQMVDDIEPDPMTLTRLPTVNPPTHAVYFTDRETAGNIQMNDVDIIPGKKSIYALTGIIFNESTNSLRKAGEGFSMKFDILRHNGSKEKTEKYAVGIVLDIKRLMCINDEPNSIMMNDHDNLVISCTIPKQCIVGYYNTNQII